MWLCGQVHYRLADPWVTCGGSYSVDIRIERLYEYELRKIVCESYPAPPSFPCPLSPNPLRPLTRRFCGQCRCSSSFWWRRQASGCR